MNQKGIIELLALLLCCSFRKGMFTTFNVGGTMLDVDFGSDGRL